MKISDSPYTLCLTYPSAKANPDLMRGWKRALTLYCRRRSNETGKPEYRYKAGVKMCLTKAGHNVTNL